MGEAIDWGKSRWQRKWAGNTSLENKGGCRAVELVRVGGEENAGGEERRGEGEVVEWWRSQ